MDFIAPIEATDVAGQGAGIRCFYVAADQRQAKPRNRVHAKLLQYGQMAVAAANQNQLLHDGAVSV